MYLGIPVVVQLHARKIDQTNFFFQNYLLLITRWGLQLISDGCLDLMKKGFERVG